MPNHHFNVEPLSGIELIAQRTLFGWRNIADGAELRGDAMFARLLDEGRKGHCWKVRFVCRGDSVQLVDWTVWECFEPFEHGMPVGGWRPHWFLRPENEMLRRQLIAAYIRR